MPWRDFANLEPDAMPRFVILRHDAPQGLHFDLLLEASGVLRTWALPQPPDSGVEMECEALPDHRMAYLDYEGPVSGGRGTVDRWDWGTYGLEGGEAATPGVPARHAEGDRSMLSGDLFLDEHVSLPKNGPVPGRPDASRLTIVVTGRKLRGRVVLQQSADDPQRWRFLFTAAT